MLTRRELLGTIAAALAGGASMAKSAHSETTMEHAHHHAESSAHAASRSGLPTNAW